MPRVKKAPAAQLDLLDARVRTAPCVPALRTAVEDWRARGYPGATETTKQLLSHWFKTDHRLPNGRTFQYHASQREAVETLIYLYEVVEVRRHKDLLEKFASTATGLRLLQYDDFARYCTKMATGSGKTKVMALAIAWQYFNAVAEGRDDYARSFLVIAPNVIVFERLQTDFGGGRIFRADPVIPPELRIFWDLDCYLRGEGERASSEGALYLTNVQQLYDRADREESDDEPDAMTAMLGPKPPSKKVEADDIARRIVGRGNRCLVVNDEAHHTHDESSAWNTTIRGLHAALEERAPGLGGLAAQLDFTATPRYQQGTLFTWVVSDYPLKQAIIDGIVKAPMKGVAAGIKEAPSTIADVRYRPYLIAGVERWREYRDQLAPLDKRPILFVMLNTTQEADQVGDYLRTAYPAEFGGDRLLVIHTDRSGEVSKKSLDAARRVAREADAAGSGVNAIVSVLMLREGWDVQNVTVIVGLRPYTAKANILPEQTVGRGLRLMFRNLTTTYTERVDVIGNKTFIEFVEQLEKDEDLALDTFEVGKDKLEIQSIAPDESKLDMDIALPTLSPILARKKTLAEEIAALDVPGMALAKPLPMKQTDAEAQSFSYEGIDIVTLEKLIEREYVVPVAQTSQEVISYYAKRVAQDVKLPSQFAALVPKVREFLATVAFGETVSLDSPAMIAAISSNVAQYVTLDKFAKALRGIVVEELTPTLAGEPRRLSETPRFPYSRPTFVASKTVFNLVTCDNDFERRFGVFLQDAADVKRFAKLPSQFRFTIEYTDSGSNLCYYEPDFVAVLDDGTHYVIETKGREDVDVAHKDRAARIWCENATLLTGTTWEYVKVPQGAFGRLQPDDFGELLTLA